MNTLYKDRLIRFHGYRLPDCFANLGEADRAYHRDIEGLTDRELVAERTLVAIAFAEAVASRSRAVVYLLEPLSDSMPAVDWLEERLHRVDAEISRRRKAVRR